MPTLKTKEIKKMNNIEREKKLNELRLELVRARAEASKSKSSKVREIKKIIARILTINKSGGESK